MTKLYSGVRQIDHWFSFGDCAVRVREYERSTVQQSAALVFLHGRFGHGEIWRELATGLSSQFRCLSIEMPGFGRSLSLGEEPVSLRRVSSLVRELITALVGRSARVILVGHDYGGAVAQLCALQWPEMIGALVLLNSSPLTRAPLRMPVGPRGLLARWRLRELIAASRPAAQAAIDEFVLDPWLIAPLRESMLRSIRCLEESWPERHERVVFRREISNQNQPVLLLWGSKDTLCPSEDCAAHLAREYKDATFYADSEGGHWLWMENPAWVSAKMREFLFRLGAQSFAA